MDRNIVYPGSIPLDTDLLTINRNAMIGIGFLAKAVQVPTLWSMVWSAHQPIRVL